MRKNLHIKGLVTEIKTFRLRPDTIGLLQYAYNNWNPRGFKTWDKFFFGISETLIGKDIEKAKEEVSKKLNVKTRKIFTK